MTFAQYLRSAVLGAALAFSCGPKESFSRDDNGEQSLEVRVQSDVTDSNGIAFNGAQEILVRDEGTPVANEEVTLYSVITQGDVYLTAANGGGIALFPDSRRRHGGSTGRELNVNVPQSLQGSAETLLSGLLRWSLTDFDCVSATSVPANGVPRVIIYSDENGRQVAFGGDYSRVQFGEKQTFYSFDPVGEGVPLLIPDAMARAVFSESLYERVRRECRGSASASCSGEVLFEDEFEGKELDLSKWDYPVALPLRDGILGMFVPFGSVILQSRSTYSLSDGPLCFEARWRVREREGVDFISALTRTDEAGIGFALDSMNERTTYDANQGECFSDLREIPSSTDLTTFNIYRFEATNERADFYLNENLLGSIEKCIPSVQLTINFDCISRDNTEKSCLIDYVKLER